VVWEGEAAPEQSVDDGIAFRAYSLLANGMGGIDWSGLPVVCAWLGVQDIDGLLHRIAVIKAHKPPEDKPGDD
jgi:hypothetical protein